VNRIPVFVSNGAICYSQIDPGFGDEAWIKRMAKCFKMKSTLQPQRTDEQIVGKDIIFSFESGVDGVAPADAQGADFMMCASWRLPNL
jgi:hypothetical protein